MMRAGFTVIEMLLTIAVLLVLVAAASPIYTNLHGSAQVNDVTDRLVQTIRTAQNRAASGFLGSAHGVHVTTDEYTLYAGDSYASRNTDYDLATTLDSAVALASTFPSGDIHFSAGVGQIVTTGTIVMTHAIEGIVTIQVLPFGQVEVTH